MRCRGASTVRKSTIWRTTNPAEMEIESAARFFTLPPGTLAVNDDAPPARPARLNLFRRLRLT
jgi:hypothetical protein